MEVLSYISIGELIRGLGVFCEIRWKIRYLAIPDKAFKVMEGIPGLLHALIQLLDAMELDPMQELVCVVLRVKFRLLMEGTALFGVGLESVIKNTLYSVVISRLGFIPRVKISGNGPPRGYVDECAVIVPAQHN